MEPIGLGDLVSMFGIILVNGVALASSFTKLNIRISEKRLQFLSLESKHRITNQKMKRKAYSKRN